MSRIFRPEMGIIGRIRTGIRIVLVTRPVIRMIIKIGLDIEQSETSPGIRILEITRI